MYDVDGNGWVDLEEMTRIVKSIFKIMGQTSGQEESPEKQAEEIFLRMDHNCDGRVSKQDFVKACSKDSNLWALLLPYTRYYNIPIVNVNKEQNP